ncbi:hypothetical protein AGR7C_Cc70020 [Agrobacterium deltaense Zutra 3/1]|uniref:Uncharacterized protein n=1 Tax=Agrobacterium deltaense Zutra 3/1 TaxID=1183427 RepID=A0A1S7QKD6_9HYPH|nr:hypothetical protein AGR7C_Cc70020 [Agrobacterium deltaense Zutra 3/1]
MRCIHKGFFSPSFLKPPASRLVLRIFDNTNIPRKSYFLVILHARENSTAIVRFSSVNRSRETGDKAAASRGYTSKPQKNIHKKCSIFHPSVAYLSIFC